MYLYLLVPFGAILLIMLIPYMENDRDVVCIVAMEACAELGLTLDIFEQTESSCALLWSSSIHIFVSFGQDMSISAITCVDFF